MMNVKLSALNKITRPRYARLNLFFDNEPARTRRKGIFLR